MFEINEWGYLLGHSSGVSSELSSQSLSLSHTNATGIHFLLAHVNCLNAHAGPK